MGIVIACIAGPRIEALLFKIELLLCIVADSKTRVSTKMAICAVSHVYLPL
jgi:hypothetical protein